MGDPGPCLEAHEQACNRGAPLPAPHGRPLCRPRGSPAPVRERAEASLPLGPGWFGLPRAASHLREREVEVPVSDRAGVAPVFLAEVTAAVQRHITLADVIVWGLAQSPPVMVSAVVVQDEYTHDVVLPFRGYWLVYDST